MRPISQSTYEFERPAKVPVPPTAAVPVPPKTKTVPNNAHFHTAFVRSGHDEYPKVRQSPAPSAGPSQKRQINPNDDIAEAIKRSLDQGYDHVKYKMAPANGIPVQDTSNGGSQQGGSDNRSFDGVDEYRGLSGRDQADDNGSELCDFVPSDEQVESYDGSEGNGSERGGYVDDEDEVDDMPRARRAVVDARYVDEEREDGGSNVGRAEGSAPDDGSEVFAPNAHGDDEPDGSDPADDSDDTPSKRRNRCYCISSVVFILALVCVSGALYWLARPGDKIPYTLPHALELPPEPSRPELYPNYEFQANDIGHYYSQISKSRRNTNASLNELANIFARQIPCIAIESPESLSRLPAIIDKAETLMDRTLGNLAECLQHCSGAIAKHRFTKASKGAGLWDRFTHGNTPMKDKTLAKDAAKDKEDQERHRLVKEEVEGLEVERKSYVALHAKVQVLRKSSKDLKGQPGKNLLGKRGKDWIWTNVVSIEDDTGDSEANFEREWELLDCYPD